MQASSAANRAAILNRLFNLVSARGDTLCNFVELPPGFGFAEDGEKEEKGDEDLRVIYRHYGELAPLRPQLTETDNSVTQLHSISCS